MHNTGDLGILAAVRAELAGLLRLREEDVSPEQVFAELGLDSARAVEFTDSLSRRLGLPVPNWLLWQHPAVGEFAAALSGAPVGAVPARTRRSERDEQDPVAIVGLGCRLPGGIESADMLWERLVSGA